MSRISSGPRPASVLLTPGPAGTSAGVTAALARGDLCHREPEFAELLDRLRRTLPAVLGLPRHETVLVTGSGTAAAEAAVLAAVRPGRSVVVVVNGVYGARLGAIAAAHGIPVHEVAPHGPPEQAWTSAIDPAQVAAALRAHPDADAVLCVQHETTTGLLNPVVDVARVAHDAGVLLVLDAVSATANEAPGQEAVAADLVVGTANKGLHGLPGMAFVLLSEQAVTRLPEVPPRGLYLDLAHHLACQRRGEVAFTPAVQVCYALDQALAELVAAGGAPARMAEYQRRAAVVRPGFERLGLPVLVPPAWRSASVTTLRLPPGVTYPPLHDALVRRGYVPYAGQGRLAGEHVRICTYGELPDGALLGLEVALGEALAEAGAGRGMRS